jgi:hypothetical protein
MGIDSADQREGMGLLEYPALRDVAHDGVLCTFSNRSSLDRGMWSISAGGTDRPACTISHPAGSLSSSQLGGRRVCPAL